MIDLEDTLFFQLQSVLEPAVTVYYKDGKPMKGKGKK